MKVGIGFKVDTRAPFPQKTKDLIIDNSKLKRFNFIETYTVNQTLIIRNLDWEEDENKGQPIEENNITYVSKKFQNDNIDYIAFLKNSILIASIVLINTIYNKKYFMKFYSRAIQSVLEKKTSHLIEIIENNVFVDGKKLSVTIYGKNDNGPDLTYYTTINYEIDNEERDILHNKGIDPISVTDITTDYTKEEFEKDLKFTIEMMLKNEGFL